MIRIKRLIRPHDRHQILRIAQVDDIVGIAGQHMDGLYLVAGNLKLDHLIRADFALLNEAVAGHHNKELPLGVVPVLALGDAGLRDVSADTKAASF